MKSLHQKAIHGIGWSFTGGIATVVTQLFTSIILARLLSPAEYGTIAIPVIFAALAGVVVDCGFSTALVQRQVTSKTEESTVFFVNVAISVVVFIVLWIASPWISLFFHDPSLVSLIRFVGIAFVINALGAVHWALIKRALDFRTPVLIRLASISVSGLACIVMAWHGCGVWALAWQVVINSLLTTVLVWCVSSWRPAFLYDFGSIEELYRFGSRLFAASLLNIFFENLYALAIAKCYPRHELGLYTRALGYQQLPSSLVTGIISNVGFPIFSKMNDDKEAVRQGYRKAIGVSMFVTVPIMLGLIACAPSLVLVVLGSQWTPLTPYFQVLCIAGLFYPIHSLNLNVLMASGRSDLFLRLEIVKKIGIVVALCLTLPFGIMGLAIGHVVTSALFVFVNTYYSRDTILYSPIEQLKDTGPYLISGLAMMAGSWSIQWFALSAYVTLPLQVILGILIYLGISMKCEFPAFIFFRRLVLREAS